MTQQKEEREVLILATYRIKKDYAPKGLHRGDVVLVVRNDRLKEYAVTLRRNGAHSCSCPAGAHGKPCYHITSSKEQFNARIEARKAVKVDAMPAQEVVVATPVAEYRMSEAVREKLVATAKPAPVVVVTPAYCIVQLGKRERYDYVAAVESKRQHKAAMLGEIAEIKARSKKDMMSAALTQNKAFSILK